MNVPRRDSRRCKVEYSSSRLSRTICQNCAINIQWLYETLRRYSLPLTRLNGFVSLSFCLYHPTNAALIYETLKGYEGVMSLSIKVLTTLSRDEFGNTEAPREYLTMTTLLIADRWFNRGVGYYVSSSRTVLGICVSNKST